ncbi:MAG: recombination mediator RecR [Elusimicrobiota bacterium]
MISRRWQNLVTAVRKLPGVGPRMAERMALYLLKSNETGNLLRTIQEAKNHLNPCSLCGVFTEEDPCLRCTDSKRDSHLICVLEEMADLEAMERSGIYRGHYHILGGVLSPLDGIGPKELRIEPLIKRIQATNSPFEEIIVATNPTVEGEATATYLAQLIEPTGKKMTRLAYGLPAGASIEYADELTIARAYEGRKPLC